MQHVPFFAAQTQTEESFLDGMAVTRPPRMAAGVYGAPHPSAVLSDAATAEVILEALDAARYGAPARHEFVCNRSNYRSYLRFKFELATYIN